MMRVVALVALGGASIGLAACDHAGSDREPEHCSDQALSFELADPAAEARFVATLVVDEGTSGSAEVVGSFSWDPAQPSEPIAFAVSAAATSGTLQTNGFTQTFDTDEREAQRELTLHRVDEADSVAITGEISISGEAIGGCSVLLEHAP